MQVQTKALWRRCGGTVRFTFHRDNCQEIVYSRRAVNDFTLKSLRCLYADNVNKYNTYSSVNAYGYCIVM